MHAPIASNRLANPRPAAQRLDFRGPPAAGPLGSGTECRVSRPPGSRS